MGGDSVSLRNPAQDAARLWVCWVMSNVRTVSLEVPKWSGPGASDRVYAPEIVHVDQALSRCPAQRPTPAERGGGPRRGGPELISLKPAGRSTRQKPGEGGGTEGFGQRGVNMMPHKMGVQDRSEGWAGVSGSSTFQGGQGRSCGGAGEGRR